MIKFNKNQDILNEIIINKKIKDLDLIAITKNIETNHYETGEKIILYKGQVGTVIMEYDGTAFEV